jgi:hypothetical protein
VKGANLLFSSRPLLELRSRRLQNGGIYNVITMIRGVDVYYVRGTGSKFRGRLSSRLHCSDPWGGTQQLYRRANRKRFYFFPTPSVISNISYFAGVLEFWQNTLEKSTVNTKPPAQYWQSMQPLAALSAKGIYAPKSTLRVCARRPPDP